MLLKAGLGVAVGKLTVTVLEDEAAPAMLVARLGGEEAETEICALPPSGVGESGGAGCVLERKVQSWACHIGSPV